MKIGAGVIRKEMFVKAGHKENDWYTYGFLKYYRRYWNLIMMILMHADFDYYWAFIKAFYQTCIILPC